MTQTAMFTWTGEAMLPMPRHLAECQSRYKVGARYRLGEVEPRSRASHNHYFASIEEAWNNLPEAMAGRWPTPDHLRKWALVQAGYRDERTYLAPSKADALRLASFITPMDSYAVIAPIGKVVHVMTAWSQREAAMGKKVFQESKQQVLDIVWALVGMTPEEAAPHVGRAA